MSGGSSGGGRNRGKTCCGRCCALLISLGVAVLIYWAIFQPHQIRATLDSAELSNLTVSNASSSSSPSAAVAVSYHVVVNLTLYNPSRRVGIYYDALAAELRYRGAVLSPAASKASPAEFRQRRRAGQAVSLEFDGERVAVPGDAGRQLEGEVRAGVKLGLELSVDARVRYAFGGIKVRQRPAVWCAVSIPVPSVPGGLGVVFTDERCRVKYR